MEDANGFTLEKARKCFNIFEVTAPELDEDMMPKIQLRDKTECPAGLDGICCKCEHFFNVYSEDGTIFAHGVYEGFCSYWKPFYFEGNQAWGWIDSSEEWKRVVKAYDGDINLLKTARRNPNRTDKDSFGFYSEYTGDERLGEFAEKHKIKIEEELQDEHLK